MLPPTPLEISWIDEFVKNIKTKDNPKANSNNGTLELVIIDQISLISFKLNSNMPNTIKTTIKKMMFPIILRFDLFLFSIVTSHSKLACLVVSYLHLKRF